MTDREKITEILKAYTKKHNIMASSVILEEYAEELVKQGVIVLPCKVGDTVWRIVTMGTGVKFKKVGYNGWQEKEQTIKHFIRSVVVTKNNFYDIVFGGDFGKTVFLTKEEAEEKLKELESK